MVTGLFGVITLLGGFVLYKINNRDHAENKVIGLTNQTILRELSASFLQHLVDHKDIAKQSDAQADALIKAADKLEMQTLAAAGIVATAKLAQELAAAQTAR